MLLVSDIHFGANRARDVAAFLNDACNPTINPERIVVIAGDMTQNARVEEYESAAELIGRLLSSNQRIVFTPGNHDFGNWPGEYLRRNHEARERFRKLLEPVLIQPEIMHTDGYDSIVKVEKDVFVVMRSTHRGELGKLGLFGNNRIKARQIEWVASHLRTMKLEAYRLHLVTHRSLWHESGDPHSGMIKRRRLESNLLRNFSFFSFINGHNHRYVYAHTTTPKLAIPIVRLALPTLSLRNKQHQAGYIRWDQPYDKPPQFIGCPSRKPPVRP